MANASAYPHSVALNGVMLRLLPRGAYSVRYTPAQPVAGFAFESQRGLHAFGSDRVRPFSAAAHGMAFTPAGCSVYSEASEGGEYLTLSGNPEQLATLGLEDGPCRLPQGQFTGRVHRQGVRAAHDLRRLMLAGTAGLAEIEAALVPFVVALCSVASDARLGRLPARSLTPYRLKLVEELIEARHAEPLAISDMAAACGLSTGFFLRAFAAAVGQTPHHYLTGRRVAAARRLLGNTGTALAEIAVQTGFCNQAHMTVCFRKHLGVTPGAYRAAVTLG